MLQGATDEIVGGASKLNWISKKDYHWVCNYNPGTDYPYCNVSVVWSEAPYKKIDFSPYDYLNVHLAYSGDANYLRIFIRNYYPNNQGHDDLQSGKFNTLTTYVDEFNQGAKIDLKELRVSDWWIRDYNVPPNKVQADVSKTIAFGIDIPHPAPLGRHEFELKSLKAVGYYFSKEVLYFSIIVFWTILLLSEMAIRFVNLQNKSKKYGKLLNKMSEQTAIYKEKAETDKLTKVLNREGLSHTIDSLKQQGLLQQYALIVLDLDHFKSINDQHGHAVGDRVLQDVAKIINACMRSYDIVARWGGEEFVVLFHCLEKSNLVTFSEKIRMAIESGSYFPSQQGPITASIGVTRIKADMDFAAAFEKADQAVYQAKEMGRNKTVVS
jgi:diguanylate cyclase (GGDEF)-like protein